MEVILIVSIKYGQMRKWKRGEEEGKQLSEKMTDELRAVEKCENT
jgi:hypothetical protein